MDYNVKFNFNDGVHDYDLPLVQSANVPKEGIKATVISGTRSDGSLIIPGGKQSQNITVKGLLVNAGNQHADIVTAIQTLNTNITTDVATLTKTHISGVTTITDYSYTVRRIESIKYPDSMQVYQQAYEITFLVLAY